RVVVGTIDELRVLLRQEAEVEGQAAHSGQSVEADLERGDVERGVASVGDEPSAVADGRERPGLLGLIAQRRVARRQHEELAVASARERRDVAGRIPDTGGARARDGREVRCYPAEPRTG